MIEAILISTLCVPTLLTLSWVALAKSTRERYGHVEPWSLWKDFRSSLTPRFVLNLVFAFNVVNLIQDGYAKFKHTTFRLIRNDKDLLVLPASVLEELSTLPSSIASPHDALEHDLLGHYTGLNLILESRLHHSILQRRLTPRLPFVVDSVEEELNFAFKECFPKCDEWTEFTPYQIFAKISAAISARILVGQELCRNPAWLDISINYTENLFRTIVVLRLFPPWTHAVLSRMLPSYWACKGYIQAARDVLSPKFEELIQKSDAKEWRPENNEQDLNVLSWLAEQAKGNDRKADTLAQVEVILALASVHTILLRMVNVLYDITAHPDLAEELKEEIESVKNGTNGWNKLSYTELPKLDSTMRESQRMSPPTVLGLKRMFKQPYTFSNGIHVPVGTYVCLPIYAIENDPQNTPNPEVFDGLRAYKKRQESGTQVRGRSRNAFADDSPFQFHSIDTTTLNFGYGKTACPGRHFATLAVKVLFVKLLTEYEFQFAPGESRPANLTVHEFLFCWPWHKMMVRRKKDEVCPF